MKKIYLLAILLIPVLSFSQFTLNTGFSLGYTGFDGGQSVAVDDSGNVYVLGSYATYLDLDPGAGVSPINSLGGGESFFAKYSSAGVLIWGKSIGGTLNDGGTEIKLDDAGNIYMTGGFQGSVDFGGGPLVAQGTDIFVVKFNSQGQHIWSKGYGGTDDDTGYSLKPAGNGSSVAICGSFRDVMDMGTGPITSHGSSNAYVALLDANGTALWAYGFGGSGFALDRATTVIQDNAGNVYATGTISGSNIDLDPTAGTQMVNSTGSSDIFVTKFNASGVFLSAFTLGGTTGENPGGMAVNANGDLYLTGYSNSDSIDIDPGPSAQYLYGQDGILFVQDIILLKFNASTQLQWGFRMGKRASDVGQDLVLDANDNVYITGGMGDSLIDFDPGVGIHYLNGDTAFLSSVPFVAEYNSNGNLVDAFALEGVGMAGGIDVSNEGKVWIIGTFQNATLDIDPGPAASILNNAGQFDAFVAAYNPANSSINEFQKHLIQVFPNPCNDYFTMNLGAIEDVEIKIYDVAGKLLDQVKTNSADRVNVKNLVPGIYFISVSNERLNFYGRILKQ